MQGKWGHSASVPGTSPTPGLWLLLGPRQHKPHSGEGQHQEEGGVAPTLLAVLMGSHKHGGHRPAHVGVSPRAGGNTTCNNQQAKDQE